jgi:hypothetical protein
MNAVTDRRAALGSILTAGTCLSAPSWAALVADPEAAFSSLLATRPATKALGDRLRQARGRVRPSVGRNAHLARDAGGIAAGVVNDGSKTSEALAAERKP